jgi:alkylated DNA repair dioxygenase AlkB
LFVFDERVSFGDGAWIHYFPRFLAVERAEQVLTELPKTMQFEEREIQLFGRRILQPRLLAWGGAKPYTYSGQTLEPRPLPELAEELLRAVNQRLALEGASVGFNHVLANLYRHGADSMGMHADDEAELGQDPVVATLSVGAERRFVLRARSKLATPRTVWDRPLASGSLFVMGGSCQRDYTHALPKATMPVEPRLSLTFRRIVQARSDLLRLRA